MLIKNINLIIVSSVILILSIGGILVYHSISSIKNNRQEEVFICGNSIYDNNIKISGSIDSIEVDGKALFQSNCASCHNPVKDATGPALRSIITVRSPDWIYKFLTDTTFLPIDDRARRLKSEYGSKCMKFPNLTPNDVEALLNYVYM